MIDEINRIIEEFEKLGYSHEEAVNIVEPATTLSDEEIERIADEFSRIGCTSFSLKYNPEVREAFKENILNDRIENIECSVEDFKRLGYTDEEAEELYKHINIYI
jgi:DNA-binding transcriptional regulator YhcF (GntR family)